LPNGAAADGKPGLVVLVIGESSRAASYSYYGYERPINQETQKAGYIALPKSQSCSTNTMITTGCILSVNGRDDWKEEATEPLPSYLHRLGIKTFVRTNNTEMPRLNVGNYQTSTQLASVCDTKICMDYNVLKCDKAFCVERYFDNILLANMGPILETAKSEKVFLLLHFRGSHGPNYSDRSPKGFTPYTPSCDAHVTQCDLDSLVNSYDNSTMFTDKTLAELAQILDGESGSSRPRSRMAATTRSAF
jgi:lipid A ethanolaminephosphotransferase